MVSLAWASLFSMYTNFCFSTAPEDYDNDTECQVVSKVTCNRLRNCFTHGSNFKIYKS